MPKQPLAEVFGFPLGNLSGQADRYRTNRLCPFNNNIPNCTKDKASDPLGVCSIHDGDDIVVVCPVRFRQDWLVTTDAAQFFFPEGTLWTSLAEVRLNNREGKSAGNIDYVLVSHDDRGRVLDFGALEVQAVYISGNIRNPFKHYMERPHSAFDMDWRGRPNYPRPDYLSSSRKRLAPQLIFKGGIFNAWRKKIAVVLSESFFRTLPPFGTVGPQEADVAWFVYALEHDSSSDRFSLNRRLVVYTRFEEAIGRMTQPEPGTISDFLDSLQQRLDKKLADGTPPDNATIDDEF